jgi:hypothetical protein
MLKVPMASAVALAAHVAEGFQAAASAPAADLQEAALPWAKMASKP